MLGKQIDIRGVNGKLAHIFSIVATNGERVLIGGENGAFYSDSLNNTLEALKQHLPEIIEKGKSDER